MCLDHVCKQKYLIDFNCDYLHCIIIISAIQFLSFHKGWVEGGLLLVGLVNTA